VEENGRLRKEGQTLAIRGPDEGKTKRKKCRRPDVGIINDKQYFLRSEIKLPVLVLAIGNPTDHSCHCFI
jgi:hypothetical protein